MTYQRLKDGGDVTMLPSFAKEDYGEFLKQAKTLSEILGHSSVKITLDRYVHSSMERKQSCMKLFSDNVLAA